MQRAISLTENVWPPGSEGKITITFKTQLNDSYVGIDSNYIRPSVNLSSLDPPFLYFDYDGEIYMTGISDNIRALFGSLCPGDAIMHEFGHVLGLVHEHQNYLYEGTNPTNDYLNKTDLLRYGYMTGNTENIENDIFQEYSDKDIFDGTPYDKNSIMNYYFDGYIKPGHTSPVSMNGYSKTDIEWLQKLYPLGDTSKYPIIHVYFIDTDEPQWKRIWVKKVIMESLAPHVGVSFIFHDYNEEENNYFEIEHYYIPLLKNILYLILALFIIYLIRMIRSPN